MIAQSIQKKALPPEEQRFHMNHQITASGDTFEMHLTARLTFD